MTVQTIVTTGFRDWREVLPPGDHTIHGDVRIHPHVHSPQLGNIRRVWLRLPTSFHLTGRVYPVIVMHDGQNAFDRLTSGVSWEEWRVDETLLELEGEGLEAIVVGVECSRDRGPEYVPWLADSVSDRYLAFLTDTILPLARAACDDRITFDPSQTLVLGSSYGGLAALYAFVQRPDIFGLCCAMSPSTWRWQQILPAYIHSHPRPHAQRGRVYVDHGQQHGGRGENSDQGCDARLVRDALIAAGYHEGRDLWYVHDEYGKHSELSWAARLPHALRLLWGRGNRELGTGN